MAKSNSTRTPASLFSQPSNHGQMTHRTKTKKSSEHSRKHKRVQYDAAPRSDPASDRTDYYTDKAGSAIKGFEQQFGGSGSK
ncbi:unnamed protein product [Clonostachys chloroleuca]|uniref:Uncharacterized protein n=1 Tax=Clonostachys chloroleuca TaxID=1926264 RepID=A0AA35LTI7_9HYPO|nr:unnamed protein product [Clonostachys chloroleuca]